MEPFIFISPVFSSERIAKNLYAFILTIAVNLLRSKQEPYANTNFHLPKPNHSPSIRTVPCSPLAVILLLSKQELYANTYFHLPKTTISPTYEQFLAPHSRCHPFVQQTGTVRQYSLPSSKNQPLLQHTNNSSLPTLAVILLRSKQEL